MLTLPYNPPSISSPFTYIPGRMIPAMLRIVVLLLLQSLLSTSATPFNATIDDTNGDSLTGAMVTYSPPASWFSVSDCESCGKECEGLCPDDIDTSRAEDSTWHGSQFWPGDSSTSMNATMTFRGTALYAYCILNADLGNSDMIFYLDGEQAGTYTYNFVDGSDVYHYSALVLQLESLSDENHIFTLSNGQRSFGNGQPSSVIFDFVQYTKDDLSISSSSTNSVAHGTMSSVVTQGIAPTSSPFTTQDTASKFTDIIIAVSVLAAALFIIVFIALFYFFCRPRRLDLLTTNTKPAPKDLPRTDSNAQSSPRGETALCHVSRQRQTPSTRIVDDAIPHTTSSSTGPSTVIYSLNDMSQSVERIVVPDFAATNATPDTPIFASRSFDISGLRMLHGLVPIPPPGIPIIDGPPPPSLSYIQPVHTVPMTVEGRGSHYRDSPQGTSENGQTNGMPQDWALGSELSQRLKSPPPEYSLRF
ncbi:hypothetical protein CERSUDRAFT_89951 [Gelatoporia subvermispora B]|uniref:4Fe-4S ferredoxin-type domain-containing protein n=1 Tax=Ceriporiopsis subvermispora (strain B) TaxID=914234 RepID=M2RAE5_CERS8|nr:hypothetical protein CERSUDRAFT_89951 [Gelatoporia subvermispora B]